MAINIETIIKKIFNGELEPSSSKVLDVVHQPLGPAFNVTEDTYMVEGTKFLHHYGGPLERIEVFEGDKNLGMALWAYPETWSLV